MSAVRTTLDGRMTLGGIRLFASEAMPTDTVEDWSRVRSPSRAARRRRQGHRQAIVYRQEPKRIVLYAAAQNAMFMHPVVLAEFTAALERRSKTDDFWTAVRLALADIGAKLGARP